MIDEDIQSYTRRYQEGKLPLAAMITHEEPLERINDLVEALKQGKVGRGLIKLGDF